MKTLVLTFFISFGYCIVTFSQTDTMVGRWLVGGGFSFYSNTSEGLGQNSNSFTSESSIGISPYFLKQISEKWGLGIQAGFDIDSRTQHNFSSTATSNSYQVSKGWLSYLGGNGRYTLLQKGNFKLMAELYLSCRRSYGKSWKDDEINSKFKSLGLSFGMKGRTSYRISQRFMLVISAGDLAYSYSWSKSGLDYSKRNLYSSFYSSFYLNSFSFGFEYYLKNRN